MSRTWLWLLVSSLSCQRAPIFANELFACQAAGDCADGFVCAAGTCTVEGSAGGQGGGGGSSGVGGAGGGTAGGAGGAGGGGSPVSSCTTTDMCPSGRVCTELLCCDRTCDGPCETCAAPGALGQCRQAGPDRTCGRYRCSGQSAQCPTSCLAGECAAGSGCVSGACVACWASFTDDFATGAQWALTGATVTGGALTLVVSSRPQMAETVSAQSVQALALTDCGVSVRLAERPDLSANFSGQIALVGPTQEPSFRFEFDGRGLVAAWTLAGGSSGSVVLAAPSATWPQWLRLEESGGVVRFRTSSGAAFTTVHSQPVVGALPLLTLRVRAGFPAQGGARATLTVDDVNRGP